jgi:hypothetical protein
MSVKVVLIAFHDFTLPLLLIEHTCWLCLPSDNQVLYLLGIDYSETPFYSPSRK